jgi:hypothetical protein
MSKSIIYLILHKICFSIESIRYLKVRRN